MNPMHGTPVHSGSERDSNGRLVGLVYESTPPPDPDADPWLIALDGSDNALRAVAHAAGQSATMKACALHIVHVQPWLAKEAAETELAHRALAATVQARATLDAAGLPWRLHVALGDPSACIIECAVRLHATTLFIGSRGLNTVESMLFGSVTQKVMHQSPVPVMVVP